MSFRTEENRSKSRGAADILLSLTQDILLVGEKPSATPVSFDSFSGSVKHLSKVLVNTVMLNLLIEVGGIAC